MDSLAASGQIWKARARQHVGDNSNHAVAEGSRNIQFASCLQKQVHLCDSKMGLAAFGWDLKKVDTGAECIFCDKKLLSVGSISVKKELRVVHQWLQKEVQDITVWC